MSLVMVGYGPDPGTVAALCLMRTRTAIQNELDATAPLCESLRVTAKIRRAKTLPAKIGQTAPTRPRKSCDIIAFPVFERHGDQILKWLSAIAREDPARRTVARVVKSMRFEVANLERVRNSVRHKSLAGLVTYAANALEDREWDGARYLLTTALGLMTPSSDRATFREGREGAIARQFPPLAETAVAELPLDAVTGTITG